FLPSKAIEYQLDRTRLLQYAVRRFACSWTTAVSSQADCSIFGHITIKSASTSAVRANPRTTVSSKPSTARFGTNALTCIGSIRLTKPEQRLKLGGPNTTRVGLTRP